MSTFPRVKQLLLKFFCGRNQPQIAVMLRSTYSTNFYMHIRSLGFYRSWSRSWSQAFRFVFVRSQSEHFVKRSVGGSGVSLGFLSYFQTEEDKIPAEERVLMHIKKSILYAERQEYVAAEQELHLAFQLSKQYGYQDVLSQVTSYQANLALKMGKLAKAEELFKFLSQRLVNLNQCTVTDNTFVEISLKLAEIYARTGRTEEAMTGFQYCVIAQKQKIEAGAEDEDTLMLSAWALHDLSQLYIRLGSPADPKDIHLAKAVFCLKKAEAHCTKAVGPDSQQAISVKSDLATALALKGNHAAAFKLFSEIEEIAKEKYTDLYSGIKVNVGNIHLQKSEFKEAGRVCSEAKDLASKFKNLEAFHRAEECLTKSIEGLKNAELSSAASASQPQAA